MDNVILEKANTEAKEMAEYYFKGNDSRKQAVVIGFNDGVKWILNMLAGSKENGAHFIARDLRDSGYSVRKIAKIMGYKHPGSISHLLSKVI